MLSGSFSAKAYAFFDTLLWIAGLNLIWVVSSLAGVGVLGVGPATAAAQILVRRRIGGEAAPLLRSFAKEYVRNFVKANALALPVLVAAVALWLNWNYFSAGTGLASELFAAGVFAASIFLAGVGCHIFPMFARYELPLSQYFLKSSRFAARHLAGTAILLFVTAVMVFGSRAVPGLIPFFSIGAWLYLTGWLCDRFFTANDESVAAAASAAEATAGTPARLPVAARAGARLG